MMRRAGVDGETGDSMAIGTRRRTFEDWAALPDDGRRHELLNGELVELAAPTSQHGELAEELFLWLRQAQAAGYGRARIGPAPVLLDAGMTHENAPLPDVFFVRKQREQIIKPEAVD